MHRFIIVALVVMSVASCDRFPDNGLQIGGMLPLEEDCTVDPGTELRRSFGVWDLNEVPRDPSDPNSLGYSPSSYIVTPLLESYIVSRALDTQAEQNNLQVTNLEILLQTPDGVDLVLPDGLPNPYSTTATTVLPAAVEDSFSSGTTASVGIPASYASAVFAAVDGAGFGEVVLAFRAVGTTMGGFTQKSAYFFWPVSLCVGCLDFCETQDAANMLTEEELAALGASCLPGQDGYPYCPFIPETEDP